MDGGFEAWACVEIGRHRSEANQHNAEADQLERVLTQFIAANGKGASAGPASPSQDPQAAPAHRPKTQRSRVSKNDGLLKAFDEAGPSGLNMEQIEQYAASIGINSNKAALRAYCWHQKQIGRLISLAAGRYASAHVDEAADPVPQDEPAASTREAHDRHREGDAGGGT